MADYKTTDDGNCDCYLTNGSTGAYFTTHKFFDFRSMSAQVNVPSPLVAAPHQASQALASNEYFTTENWTKSWAIQHWNNSFNLDDGDANLPMVNSPANVYFESNTDDDAQSDTYLVLRTVRQEDNFQTAAEFQSVNQTFHYVSVRMYARTVGSPGAITAMFTYLDNDDPSLVQESDLEIRTMDPPDSIQYTNQPSFNSDGDAVAAATRNATVPVAWDQWAVHRMDWSPESTMWYIDGVNVSQISFQTPRDPSLIIFNAWSDGAAWSGNMSVGDAAHLQIQWIEMVFNSTNATSDSSSSSSKRSSLFKRDDDKCGNVCSIDETDTIGTPVLIKSDACHLGLGRLGVLMPVLLTATMYLLL